MLWEKINQQLKKRGWTIYRLCAEAGIGTALIYNLRDGKVKDLHFKTVQKIARALGVSLDEFNE